MARTRRGSTFYPAGLGNLINQYEPGDIVKPFIATARTGFDMYGVVREVNPAENKIYVAWMNGYVTQEDPEMIVFVMLVDDRIRDRLMERIQEIPDSKIHEIRGSIGIRNIIREAMQSVPHGNKFMGDPKKHGIDAPRSEGGFAIMRNLVKDLREESYHTSAKTAKTRRAVYHKDVGRVYKQTRAESEGSIALCPKCKKDMELQPFTKGSRIYICPECGWKITTDKLVATANNFKSRRAVALSKIAFEFDNQDQLDKYLKEHPAADKSLHYVKKEKKLTPEQQFKQKIDKEIEDKLRKLKPIEDVKEKVKEKIKPLSKKEHTHDLGSNGGKVRVYDNGGETADRYTVVMDDPDWDASVNEGMKAMITLSDEPEHPQGVSQFGEGKEGEHLGKPIKWDTLPINVKKHVMQRLSQKD